MSAAGCLRRAKSASAPWTPRRASASTSRAFDLDDRFSSHADVGSSRWHFWDAGLHPATEAERAQVAPGLLDVGQTCLPVAMVSVSVQPAGSGRLEAQIECCPSWFTTTVNNSSRRRSRGMGDVTLLCIPVAYPPCSPRFRDF